MTENQLREERRALLTWFARNGRVGRPPRHWQRNIDRFKEVSHELHRMTGNPIYKSRT